MVNGRPAGDGVAAGRRCHHRHGQVDATAGPGGQRSRAGAARWSRTRRAPARRRSATGRSPRRWTGTGRRTPPPRGGGRGAGAAARRWRSKVCRRGVTQPRLGRARASAGPDGRRRRDLAAGADAVPVAAPAEERRGDRHQRSRRTDGRSTDGHGARPARRRGGRVPGWPAPAGVTARWAGSGSLPVHVEPQPTSVALPSAACSPSDSGPWSTPPPTCPTASRRPATPSTWWVVRCATPSWPATARRPADAAHDLDFTTDARPDDIEAVVRGWADAVWTQGKRFGTIGCLHGAAGSTRSPPTGPRPTTPTPASPRWPSATASRTTSSRRDFTVNAMALRLPDLELIDPFGGLVDLAERRLRTPLDPEVSFADDPLRMLRAARFMARLGPRARPRSWWPRSRAGHGRLSIVSAERIRDELDKIMVVPVPSTALWFVVRTGLAERVPARAARPGPRAGPDPPAQGRAGPHPGRGGQDRRPTGCCAWPPSSTTWASPGPGPSWTAG